MKDIFHPKSLPKHHFDICLREWISCIFPHSQIHHLPANCYSPSVLSGYQTMGEDTKCSFSFQPNLSLKCQGEVVWQHVNPKFCFANKKKKKERKQEIKKFWLRPESLQNSNLFLSFVYLCLWAVSLVNWYSWHNAF